MASVADLVRLQRQSIAEQNSNARYTQAGEQLAYAVARASNDMRPPTYNPMTPLEEARLRKAGTLQGLAEMERQKSIPCPTGYKRNASGECVVTITTVSSLLPESTEFMGPTISYNREPTTFQQMRSRPSPLPGQAYSSVLSGGLGYSQSGTAISCSTAKVSAIALLKKIEANCALISRDGGQIFDVTAARKTIKAVIDYCNTPVSVDGLGAFTFVDPGNAYRTDSASKGRDVQLPKDLSQRLLTAQTTYATIESAYPAIRGACRRFQRPAENTSNLTVTTGKTENAWAESSTTPSSTTVAPTTTETPTDSGGVAPPPELPPVVDETKPFYKAPWFILLVGVGAAYAFMKK